MPLRIALVLLVAWIATRILHRVIRRMVQRVRDQGSLSLLGTSARLPVSETAKLRRAQRAATAQLGAAQSHVDPRLDDRGR